MKRLRLPGAVMAVTVLVLGMIAGLTSSLTAGVAMAATVIAPTANDTGTVNIPFRSIPHPLVSARPAAPARWTVRAGESLSVIAAKAYGSSTLWPALWWVNKAHVHNPNLISAGQVLKLSAWHPSVAWLDRAALRAIPAPAPVPHAIITTMPRHSHGAGNYRTPSTVRTYQPRHSVSLTAGTYSYAGLEALWISAGGPAWAASHAASIAECESGGRTNAYNPSGATGLWQILGSVVAGNLYNPYVNALNAVAKFKASGDTFAQWVCQ